MSSTDSAPQSEPTSDEQPDLGAFTTVLRAWTYLQPPPRIPVQIYSPTSSTTTTFQPDQSVADSDFPSRSRNSSSHAPPSSFTRPPSSSVVHEESTVWNHAPIASYLYSETPSLDHEDEGSTEGGRTVEINSESSFDDHSSSVPSQHPYLDVPVPVSLEPSLLLTTDLTTDSPSSSALISHLRNISRNPLPPSSSSLSLLSYQIPETPLISIQEESELVVAQRVLSVEVSTTTTSASLKSQRAPSSSIANSISTSTPTFGPLLATSALPVQQQHRTVPIHPPPQTVSDDASVSHLSLPPPGDSPLQPMPASLHHPNSNPHPHPHPHPHSHPHLNSHPSPNPNPNPHPYPPQQQAPPTSIPQPQPTLGMEASISTSLLTQRGVGGGLGTIVVDDLRTPDQTPDSLSVDWRRSGRSGRFRPVDDHEVEVVEKRSHTYGFGFGFGRVQQQGRGQGQKHVSGYTSNYEGSQSSFRARKSSEMKGRSTRLESQNEDNEDTGTYSDLAEHCYEDQDRDEEEEDSPFPRRRGRFYSQSHTPRYYGRTHTPPGGVLPTQPPLQQSIGQTQSQSSSGLNYDRYSQTQPNIHTLQPQHHLDSNHSHSDPHSDPEPYPRPHARPLIQDGDRDDNIYPSNSNSHSSMSSMSSLSSLLPSSSPPCSNVQPSPSISSSVQQDYVLVQPQTQPLVQMPVELFSQQSQSQLPQTQTQTSYPVSYLSTQNPGSSYLLTTMTSLDLAPVSAPVPVSTSAVSLSVPPSVVSVSIIPVVPNSPPATAAATSSSIYQGQGTGTSQHHKDPPPLLLSSASAKLGPCSISSPSALPSNLIETLKPDKSDETEGGGKSGTPDKPERARWDCVDLEEDELVPVSGRSSSVGGGVNSGSGLTSVLGISQPPPKAQKSRPTNKLSAKQQQRRRPLELQSRQFDALTLPHVESDSGGWEDGGIGLASATTTSTITATSTSTIISTTNDSQPPDPDPDPNPNSNSQHARTNDNPHSHSHSDSHRYSQSHYPGFHSDSHVAHMEDTESDLDLDDNLGAVDVDDHDAGARAPATVRVRRGAGGAGSPGGDALLPSLGYLDEALRFIAAERARWSAAREVGGPSGSGAGGGATKRGGRKTEDRKVLDYDMDAPKRKRRRKRPPKWQHQPHVLPSSNPGALDTAVAPPPTTAVPLNPLHVADEDGGGPSTPTSSARKKKRARSSSWSPVKKKHGSNSSKGKEKEFLVAPPQPSSPPLDTAHPPPLLAISAQGERDQLQPISVVPRSKPGGWLLVKGQDQGFSKKDEDGGRTPTNGGGVMEDVFGPVTTGSTILSSGKRGKKNMGKKEKERERMKKDLLIGRSTGKEVAGNCGHEAVEDEEDDHGDNDDDDEKEQDDDDDDDDDDDISIEDNSSLNDLSILQPPRSKLDPSRRQKGKDIAYIHSRAGIAGGGAYKSTPGSPKRRRGFDDDIHVDREESGHGSLGDRDVDVEDNAVVPYTGPGKKHTPSKRVKGLVHVRSVPQLRLGAEETPTLYAAPEETTVSPSKVKSKKAKLKAAVTAAPAPAHNGSGGVDLLDMGQPQTKRSRLIVLTKKLREFFPEQREALRRVTIRLERQGIAKGKKNFLTSGGSSGGGGLTQRTSVPIPVPGVRKLKRGIHYRTVSEGASVDADDDFIEGDGVGMPEVDEEDEELDPRGRPPKKSDVLIHVFIDHSNILIGLLSHLKRFPLTHAVSKGTKRGHPLPTIPAKATPTVSMSHVTTSALAFASVKPTSARPLPNPNSIISGNSKVSSSSIPIAVPGDHHPIPLPSFATMSRSLPSGSVLNKYPEENNDVEEKDVRSDGYESHRQGENDEDVDDLGQITSLARAWKPGEKEKRSLKHLWHAALVLLLERGRSVTRRVIVTSSPLYQPMDGIERLGYELRVYVRVPDLGNGMDRDRHKDKGVSGSLSGGSKSAQSSPANAVSFSGLPLSTRKNKREMLGHVRRFSGSTSTESGSGGGGSGHASGTSNPHSYHGIANNTPPQGKIKYREQGVDELLQLKLHQALAATDDVPKGSTIVLATGDGNMGQFNEEGFLGPVRTALKRGWKVELYAWEDGLSRAWRREFGEGTEWGRKGMFRVIGMEQFAGSLVEIIDQ